MVMVAALGIPGILLFCVGVPAFSALFLHRHRTELRNRQFYQAYSFLYADYEDRCYYWVRHQSTD